MKVFLSDKVKNKTAKTQNGECSDLSSHLE